MTHKISLSQPKTIVNAIAGSLTFLAVIAAVRSENPSAKTLSWIVAVSSAAIGVVNEATFHLYEEDANNQIQAAIRPRDKKIAELNEEVRIKRGIENQLKQEQSANKKLSEIVAKLRAELASYQGNEKEKLFADAVLDNFLVNTKEILNAHIEETIENLKTSVDAKMRRIKDERVLAKLQNFQEEIENKYFSYKVWISSIERGENLDFVTDAIEISNQIHHELASLKVKFIRTLSICDRLKLKNAINREKARNALARLAEIHRVSYEDVIDKIEESEHIAANNDEYVKHIIAELEKAMERLAQKDEEIKALKRPQYWTTPTRDDQWVANIIIGYFEQLGITLDRAHNDYDKWQATLHFHVDRNKPLVMAKDLNEHSNKIGELAHILNTPEFKFDGELGLMTVWVQIANQPTQTQTENLLDEYQNSASVISTDVPPEHLY